MSSKSHLYMQSKMKEVDTVPRVDKQMYSSIVDMLDNDLCPLEQKLDCIGIVAGLATVNGVTKDDLRAMLR